jgi:hypothetical protein
MGSYLKEHLPAQVIEDYYRGQLKPYERKEGQLYLSNHALKEYLVLGFDFQTLCRLVMTDPEGNQLTPEEFMRELLNMKLHVEVKETFDYTATPRDRGYWEGVDNIQGLFGRLFGRMFGAGNDNVDAYYPLDSICEDFQAVLGPGFDAKGLAEALIQQQEPLDENSAQAILYENRESSFFKIAEEREAKRNQYAIASNDDLMDFRQLEDGSYSTVAPDVHEALLRDVRDIQGFGDRAWSEFSTLDREGRAEWFRCYYQEMITEELHQKMLDNIMDDDFIKRYVAIYKVDCSSSDRVRTLVHALLWNQDLQDYYWKLAAELPAVDEETAENEGESV